MEQAGIQEILKALQLHSKHIDEKLVDMRVQIDNVKNQLESRIDKVESRMDERFDRIEKKLDGMRVELTETQETVDYLSSKNVQHEKKLRQIYERP